MDSSTLPGATFVTLLEYFPQDTECEVLGTGLVVAEGDDCEIDQDIPSILSGVPEEDRPSFEELFLRKIRLILRGNSSEEGMEACFYFLFKDTKKILLVETAEDRSNVWLVEPEGELRVLKADFRDSKPWK